MMLAFFTFLFSIERLDNARELLLASLSAQVFIKTHTDITNQQTATQSHADFLIIDFN